MNYETAFSRTFLGVHPRIVHQLPDIPQREIEVANYQLVSLGSL
jgi:hypothetical protein